MWQEFINLTRSLDALCESHCGSPKHSTPMRERLDTYSDSIWHRNHINKFYFSSRIEMAHTSVIDLREERGLWMMHTALFAKDEYPMPVYGFDVICGERKVTGCFHDISPTGSKSEINEVWKNISLDFAPAKNRKLPEWANFFSDNMIVMGATDDMKEIQRVCEIGYLTAKAWFDQLEKTELANQGEAWQHYLGKSNYCQGQLKNERSKTVLANVLGMDKDYVERFKNIQFPF